MIDFSDAAAVLQRGVENHSFPAAVAEVGNASTALWREAWGRLDYDPESPATRHDTIFDLASLTKVIATTSLVMRLIEVGTLRLDQPVGR